MQKYKSIIAAICLLCMVFSLAGCSGKTGRGDNIAEYPADDVRYKGIELSPPEVNYIFSSVSTDENGIYAYGYPFAGEDSVFKIYFYNLSGELESCIEIPKYSDKYRGTIMHICADNCGKLWLLKYLNEYKDVNGAPKISDNISSWVAEAYDKNGELFASFTVGDNEARWTNISANGEYVIIAGRDGLTAFDYKGNEVSSVEDSYVVTSFFDCDGQAYVVFNKLGKKQVGVLDIRSSKISESYEIPDTANRVMIDPDNNYDFLVEMSGALYGADKQGGTFTLIANFVDYSIIHNSKGIFPLPGREILIYNAQRLQKFSPFVGNEEMISLTLGTLDSRFLSDMVEKFNASNSKYEIKIVDYSQYNLSRGSFEGIMKLNTEIISGSGPDIFDLCSLPVAQYERAGILVDLYPYINSDEQTKNVEFVAPVINAVETNDKLYKLIPAYSILTCIGSEQFFEESALNFEQLAELTADGKDPFHRTMTKRSFLDFIISVDAPAFIDLETKTCNFNNDSFIKMLKYMNGLPDTEEPGSEAENIMSGEQLLSKQYVSGYHDICYFNYMFNNTVCFPGVPASQKAGGVICPYLCFGISQNCRDKEGAWEFLKQYLLGDYQNLAAADGLPFPICKSAFELKKNNFRKWVEESGEMYVGPDSKGKDVTLHISGDAGKEAIRKIDDLFDTIMATYNNDFKLPDLIWECIAPYFAGEKAAEEVSAAVQSRVSIYLSEQYG